MMPDQDNPQRRTEEAKMIDRAAIQPLIDFLSKVNQELQSPDGLSKWQKLEQDISETVGFHYVLYSRPLNPNLEFHVTVALPQLLADHPDRDSIENHIGNYIDVYISGTLANQFTELVKLSNSDQSFLRTMWPEKFAGQDLISLQTANEYFAFAIPPNQTLPLISQLGQRLRRSPGLEPTNWTPIGIASTERAEEVKRSRAQAASLFQLLGKV